MIDSPPTPDYYTVLQVHPGADHEIIEAAYRQLMKKHHPDVAGSDPRLAAEHHQRAKIINQAHSVLRDPVQRQRYDTMRSFGGTASAPPPPRRSETDASRAASVASSPGQAVSREPAAWVEQDASMVGAVLRGPFVALAAVYYLLPGQYEWEGGQRQELLTTCLLAPVGIAAFALATVRLAPWVGHSPIQTFLAWAFC